MTAPAFAERVTVNAGSVDVSVVCETSDVGSDKTWVSEASFSFDALTAHEYVITERDCNGCVRLKDETTGDVVAEFPTNDYAKGSGFHEDLSTSDHTATIKGFSCRLSDRKISSLVVEAGHTYMFLKTPFGEKCISLYDNTFDSTPIACEPYEKVD